MPCPPIDLIPLTKVLLFIACSQERLVLSVLPRFVVLEMINDMTNVEDEHLQHQFHRIYIHRYENVR